MAKLSVVLRRTARPALLAALTAATALAVALARQKQSLEGRYFELAARLHEPYVGMYVPAVRVPSVQGDAVLIGDAERQVLFVFGTDCPYSQATLASWKAVAGQLAEDSRVRVYGVSVDSLNVTRTYVLEQALTFPVVTFTDTRIRTLYRLQAVPQTVILDEQGRVVFARPGVIESHLAVDSILAAAQGIVYR